MWIEHQEVKLSRIGLREVIKTAGCNARSVKLLTKHIKQHTYGAFELKKSNSNE
jgi:hypothetical protein